MFRKKLAFILALTTMLTSIPVYGQNTIQSQTDAAVESEEADYSEGSDPVSADSADPSKENSEDVSKSDPADEENTEKDSEEEKTEAVDTEDGVSEETEDEEALLLEEDEYTGFYGPIVNGEFSDSIIWTFDSETGTLTFTGSGSMYNMSGSSASYMSKAGFYAYKSLITNVVFSEGITSVGNYVLYRYDKVASVSIPDTVTNIGKFALYGNTELKTLDLPSSVVSIDSYAIYQSGITDLYIRNSECKIDETGEPERSLVIHGYKGSSAWIYAQKYSLEFVPIDPEEPDPAEISGKWGTNLTWTLNYTTGVLTISGTGAMSSSSRPVWTYGKFAENIKTVIVENGVTSIAQKGFLDCANMTEIDLPDSVVSIGNYAFSGCKSLGQITLPSKITSIPEHAFSGCEALETVTSEGDGIKDLSDYAFYGCKALESVSLGTNLTTIGSYAFTDCESLPSVTLKGSFTSISQDAFKNCKSLKEIVVPDNVTAIGARAFMGCESLENVTLSKNLLTIGNSCFESCKKLESIVIPNSVTRTFDSVFRECSALKNVTLPSGLNRISANMFTNCASLEEIELPSNLDQIGSSAFLGCTALTSLTFPETLNTIETCAFQGCRNLESISIPEGVTTLNSYTFWDCDNLSEVNLPKSLNHIYDFNFKGCPKLTDIYLPGDTCRIDRNRYYSDGYGIPKGKTIHGKRTSEAISYAAEYAIKYVNIDTDNPCGLFYSTNINSYWEYEKEEHTLRIVASNSTVTSSSMWSDIRKEADAIVITGNVKKISSGCFSSFAALKMVTLPETVNEIESNVFMSCPLLTDAYIENKNLILPLTGDVFSKDTTLHVYKNSTAEDYAVTHALKYEIMDPDTEDDNLVSGAVKADRSIVWRLEDGVLTISGTGDMPEYDYSSEVYENTSLGYRLTKAPWRNLKNEIRSVVVEDGITRVGSYSFSGIPLEKVSLSESVTSIGSDIFRHCRELKDVRLPSGITAIPMESFYSCESLESLDIPETVTLIGSYAFFGCNALEDLSLPENLLTIENNCFMACNSFRDVVLPAKVKKLPGNAFGGCKNLNSVTVMNPDIVYTSSSYPSVDAPVHLRGYDGSTTQENAAATKTTFESLDTGVITGYVNTNLTWTLEEGSLTISGKSELMDCITDRNPAPPTWTKFADRIVSAKLDDGITSIGYYTLADLPNLETVEIPDSVTNIKLYAFRGDVSLKEITIPVKVTAVGSTAFAGCDNLGLMTFMNPDTSIPMYEDTLPKSAVLMGYGTSTAKNYATKFKRSFIAFDDKTMGLAGSGVIWKYDSESKTLTLEGNGSTYYFEEGGTGTRALPWEEYLDEIEYAEISNGIQNINEGAFDRCANLKRVTAYGVDTRFAGGEKSIPKTAELTGYSGSYLRLYALDYDRKFVAMDDGTIGGTCGTNLTWSVDLDAKTITISGNGAMNSYYYNRLAPWSRYASYVTDLIIEEGTTSIGDYAFYSMNHLETVSFPTTLKRIGDYAFAYCYALDGVKLPDQVVIADNTFTGVIGSVSAQLPSDLGSDGVIEAKDLYPYRNLKEIILPESVTQIAEGAFAACTSLRMLTILNPQCVIYDAENTIYQAAVIKGYSDSTARAYAVKYKRTFIALDGMYFFGVCGEDLTWSLDAETGEFSLSGSGKMTNYSKTKLPVWAEYGNLISKIVFPEGQITVGNYAFYGCSGLLEVVIPQTVTSVGTDAFAECTNLKKIEFASVETAILGEASTIPEQAVIMGYTSSKAGVYANKYGHKFVPYDGNYSGVAGENAFWSYDIQSNTLTIYGSGAMSSYTEENTVPWAEYAADIKFIDVAETIRSVGSGAFSDCTALVKVTIHSADTAIYGGEAAFAATVLICGPTASKAHFYALDHNRTFESLDGVKLGGKCGDDLTWSLDLDSRTLTIEGSGEMYDYNDGANRAPWYRYANYVNTLLVKADTKSIGAYAFFQMTKIKTIELPDTLEKIGMYAFAYCKIVTGLKIPSSVQIIGKDAFEGVDEIGEISLPGDALKDPDKKGELTKDDLNPYRNAAEIVVPESVTLISEGAFADFYKLKLITILNPECEIFDAAHTIYKGATIKGYTDSTAQAYAIKYDREFVALDDLFFRGKCGPTLFWNLDIREGRLFFTGKGTMYDYSGEQRAPWYKYRDKITSVTLPEGITSIGNYAFADCENFKEIIIPEGVTSIGDYAFMNCRALAVVRLANSLRNIGKGAFMYCVSLAVISIPEGVTKIKENTFSNCGNLTNVKAPGAADVEKGAFSDCKNLVKPTIPSTANVDTTAFDGCDSIRSKNILSDVEEVKDETFKGCEELEVIYIPQTVKKIGMQALALCTKLKAVTIMNRYCTIYDAQDTIYETAVIYGYRSSTAQSYAKKYGRTFVALDGSYAAGVTDESDRESSLTWALNLETGILTISGDGQIPDYASPKDAPWYRYRDSIEKIIFQGNITGIGSYAFYDEDALTEIVIPDMVESIGEHAFADCDNLQKVEMPELAENTSDTAFEGCETLEAQKKAQEKTEGKTEIDSDTFAEDKSSVKVVYLDETISSIGERAFDGYLWLQKITIKNPDCVIYDSASTIYKKAVIYGFDDSTAEAYADKYSREFVSLSEKPEPNPPEDPAEPEGEGVLSVSLKNNSFIYTGEEIEPEVIAKVDYENGASITLVEDVDYTVSYSENVNAGTGHATVVVSGDYADTVVLDFTIRKKSMAHVAIDPIDDMPYTGSDLRDDILEQVVVRDGDEILEESDYTLSIVPNTKGNAKKDTLITVSVKPSADGNYEGTPIRGYTNFYIIPKMDSRTNFAEAKPELKSLVSIVYTGKALKPAVKVMFDGQVVSSKKYTLVYADNVDAGTGTVYALGKGIYYGKSQILEYTIEKKSFKYVKAAKPKTIEYQPNLDDQDVKITFGKTVLKKGEDYKITAASYDASALASAKKIKVELVIEPLETCKNFDTDTVKLGSIYLTKRNIKSKVTTRVQDEDGEVAVYYKDEKLVPDVDYTVRPGKKGKRIITGIGIYTGSRTL